jgi:NADH:ubiquinone reductase (H+-translocating)
MAVGPKVVIVGAGFGGLAAAKKLSGEAVDVLIIDRNNYHLFTPLLYQVASSLLNPSDIAQPVRSIFRGSKNVRFRQATVSGIDFEQRLVKLADGREVPYEYLVIAAGSTTNYFGLAGAEDRALGLKDLPEALELRNHILRCLEKATLEDEAGALPWLTFVVVGGGPTGVEYAGALSELVRTVVPREYPELARRQVRVMIVEGQAEVLPPFPRTLGAAARKSLEKRGIEVVTGQLVKSLDGDAVVLASGERVEAKTLVWAAGVKPSELAADIAATRSRSGRIEVDQFLRVKGHENVFAVGDVASFQQDGKEVAMLSAPAMQEARIAAANILATIRKEPLRQFHYRDKGTMATIGKNSAVAHVWKFNFTGFIGWLLWLVVHLYYIIGFRNRLVVLIGWAWNYFRSDRPVRIIAKAK